MVRSAEIARGVGLEAGEERLACVLTGDGRRQRLCLWFSLSLSLLTHLSVVASSWPPARFRRGGGCVCRKVPVAVYLDIMVASLLLENWYWCSTKQIERKARCCTTSNLQFNNEPQMRRPSITASRDGLLHRRLVILCSSISLISMSSLSNLSPIKAEEKKEKEDEGDDGVIGAVKSLFDPNEKTKTGKVLPKAYVKAAREVVKTLKESLEEDAKDVAKFRRTADAAKEAIREYLNGWGGQKAVVAEESYSALEKAIRSLANFYSKAGPFAPLSDDVKSSILEDLNTADANI